MTSIQKIVSYRTSDGEIFNTKDDAIRYEKSKTQANALVAFMTAHWKNLTPLLVGSKGIASLKDVTPERVATLILLPNIQELKRVLENTPDIEE